MAGNSSKKKKYYYRRTIEYCPICGYEKEYRERVKFPGQTIRWVILAWHCGY